MAMVHGLVVAGGNDRATSASITRNTVPLRMSLPPVSVFSQPRGALHLGAGITIHQEMVAGADTDEKIELGPKHKVSD